MRGQNHEKCEFSKGTKCSTFAQSVMFLNLMLLVVVPVARCEKLAMAFGGGGFLSVANQSGAIAGLLSVLCGVTGQAGNKKDGCSLSDSSLMSQVDIFSTISGGSWFAALLMYTPDFLRMIQQMAGEAASTSNNHDKLSSIYNEGYANYYIQLGDDAAQSNEIISKIGESLPNEETRQTLFLLASLFQNLGTPVTWIKSMEYFLPNLSADTTLGDPNVQDWCKGKDWAIIVAVTAPPAPIVAGDEGVTNGNAIYYSNPKDRTIPESTLHYTLQYDRSSSMFDESLNVYPESVFFPARFSVTLGAENPEETPAPMPYSDIGSQLSSMKVQYKGKNWQRVEFLGTGFLNVGFSRNVAATSRAIPPGLDATMDSSPTGNVKSFHSTPVHGAVGASSSFLGQNTLVDYRAERLQKIGIDPNVWFSSTLKGKDAFDIPFQMVYDLWTGKRKVDRRLVNDFADMALHDITDGGPSDILGLATAVSSGASKVFVIPGSFEPSLEFYFSGRPDANQSLDGSDGRYKKIDPIIFEENYEEIQRSIAETSSMILSPNNNHLTALKYLEIQGTTVENNYFGIEAGRLVTMYLLQAESALTIGTFQDFSEYGELVADIIQSLVLRDNRDTVISMMTALTGT